MTKKPLSFTEDDVHVLKGLDQIRGKPTMYIGNPDSDGLFTILREPADNAGDEWAAGRCNSMTIRLLKDGYCEVHDDGQGMPVGTHKTEKIPTIEVLVSMIHAGGKLKASDAYKHSTGTHGLGIKASNALSTDFRIITKRDNKWWTIAYAKGKKTQDLTELKPAQVKEYNPIYKHGTIVRFKPDLSIFDKGSVLDLDKLKDWCDLKSYLYGGFSITLIDEVSKKPETIEYYHEGGTLEWLESAIEDLGCGTLTNKPIDIRLPNLELCFTFTDADGMLLDSYTNGLYQSEGGNHLNTTLSAVYKTVSDYATKTQTFTREDIVEGIVGILNFKVDSPKFGSQTKNKLTDSRFEELCEESLYEELTAYWNKNKGVARDICRRASELRGAKAQFTMQKKQLADLKKRAGSGSKLPTKLAMVKDCPAHERELYCVEGDSAAGTARSARMTTPYRYQETLGLKGKVTNMFKAKGIPDNEEVLNILTALGYDPTVPNPTEKLRVGKIILLSDPDPDGYHINTLLLGLLLKLMPEVFDKGMVYTVVSPKYVLADKGVQYFAMTMDEMKQIIPKGVNPDKASYLKGWGEASATAMRQIAFNPETRKLVRIEKPDARAQKEIALLMGEDSEYRKKLLGI